MSAAAKVFCWAMPKSFSSRPNTLKPKKWPIRVRLGKCTWLSKAKNISGPHSPWFWDVELSGGGALMDLGCHGIAFCYWFLGRPAIKSIYAQLDTLVHGKKTKGDDEAICIIEFENGARGLVEDSWNQREA